MNAQLTPLREKRRSSESGVYTWTFPGAPIRIEIDLELVARLEAVVIGTSKNSGMNEIGGVLLGTVQSPSTIQVNDYALIEAEPDSKRGYVADTLELERLCSGNDRARTNLQVVGYFRTQREPALELRSEEMKTIRRHFSDSRQVVLLIRSSAEQCNAGFLFWDGGVLSPFSFLEFPFSAGVLRSEVKQEPGTPSVDERPVEDDAPQVASIVSESKNRVPRIALLGLSIALVLTAAVFAFKARGRFGARASADSARTDQNCRRDCATSTASGGAWKRFGCAMESRKQDHRKGTRRKADDCRWAESTNDCS